VLQIDVGSVLSRAPRENPDSRAARLPGAACRVLHDTAAAAANEDAAAIRDLAAASSFAAIGGAAVSGIFSMLS